MYKPIAALCAALVLCLRATPSPAQTCQAPIAILANSSYHDTTCDGTNIAETLCFGVANPGPNIVFSFALDLPYTGELTLQGSSAFEPVMYLLDGTLPCDSGACFTAGTTTAPILLDGLLPGQYWLIVGASPDSSPGACGEFTLVNVSAALDSIFAGDFDP